MKFTFRATAVDLLKRLKSMACKVATCTKEAIKDTWHITTKDEKATVAASLILCPTALALGVLDMFGTYPKIAFPLLVVAILSLRSTEKVSYEIRDRVMLRRRLRPFQPPKI